MPEVYSVYVTVRRPTNGDTGQFTTGYYTLADGVLTMTDSKGRHVRSTNGGDAYRHKMRLGDDPRAIAGVLTLEIHRMLRGETAQTAGFNRPLKYQPSGVA